MSSPNHPCRKPSTSIERALTKVALMIPLSSLGVAQTVVPVAAPLPAALTTAHKLFLGNAGDQENADCLRAYNQAFNDLQALNRFTLVDDPVSADLILEMHYEIALGQSFGQNAPRQFRLLLIDPRTHVILWSLTERTNYAVRQSNRDKNLDETVDHLVADFSALTQSQPPADKSRITHGFPIH